MLKDFPSKLFRAARAARTNCKAQGARVLTKGARVPFRNTTLLSTELSCEKFLTVGAPDSGATHLPSLALLFGRVRRDNRTSPSLEVAVPPCFRFKTTFHLESEDPSLKRKGFQSVLNSHTSSYYVLLMFGLQVARPATVVLERARSSVR